MPRKNFCASEEEARARFYRGRLLAAAMLSPADFFNTIIPLYNRLNGNFVVENVSVAFSITLFDPNDSAHKEVIDAR